jgi:Putative Ig domain
MPLIPCPTRVNCPCDVSPLLGLNSAAPDVPNSLGVRYGFLLPNLGNTSWQQLKCVGTATAADQATADLLAQRNAILCILQQGTGNNGGTSPSGGGAPANVFFNAPQSCTVNCPDGLPFTFTVGAGLFIGTSQIGANSQAFNYACQQAQARAVCLSALSPGSATQSSPYTGTIVATGGLLAGPGQTNNWQLVSGSLPPGLTFNGGQLASNSVTITGTPTTPGTYSFVVECTDPSGDTMTKPYSLTVAACTPGPEGYQVLINQGGWTLFTPPAPYDTGFGAPPLIAGTAYHFQANFHSPTLKTWNWVVRIVAHASPGASVTVNGVSQNIASQGSNLWQATGSFNTQDCTPTGQVVLDINGVSDGTGTSNFQVVVEWQTP